MLALLGLHSFLLLPTSRSMECCPVVLHFLFFLSASSMQSKSEADGPKSNKEANKQSKESSSFEEHHHRQSSTRSESQPKKRIPHSIDELLKTPTRSTPSSEQGGSQSSIASYHSILFQPPCGILVDKPCTCNFLSSVSGLQVHPSSSVPRNSSS